TWTGAFTPDGNSIIHPLVSAVAVSVYFTVVVSLPPSGVAAICHLPAKSASVTAGVVGAGGAAAGPSFAGSCACSCLTHAETHSTMMSAVMLRCTTDIVPLRGWKE